METVVSLKEKAEMFLRALDAEDERCYILINYLVFNFELHPNSIIEKIKKIAYDYEDE